MGGSSSKNSMQAIANASANQVNTVAQKVENTNSNLFLVNITGRDGDINITDVNVDQSIKASISAFQEATLCNSAAQTLTQELKQSAESISSGLNLGNTADASNDASMMVNMAVNLRNHVSQECVANNKNEVVYNVSGGTGNVNMQRVNVKQAIDSSIVECAQRVYSSNDSMQKASQSADQSAKAVAKGLDLGDLLGSLVMLLAVAAIIILLFVGMIIKAKVAIIKSASKLAVWVMMVAIVVASFAGTIVLWVKSDKFPTYFMYHSVNVPAIMKGKVPSVVRQVSGVTMVACGQKTKESDDANVFVWEPPSAETVRDSSQGLAALLGTCKMYLVASEDLPKQEDYERARSETGELQENANRLTVPFPCGVDANGMPNVPPLPSGSPK